MSDNNANPILGHGTRPRAPGARKRPTWANDNAAYPPRRDAVRRLAEKRIAEKRRAARCKQASCLTRQSGGSRTMIDLNETRRATATRTRWQADDCRKALRERCEQIAGAAGFEKQLAGPHG